MNFVNKALNDMANFLERNLGKMATAAIISAILGLAFAADKATQQTQALVQECMQDGHAHYECEALFYRR